MKIPLIQRLIHRPAGNNSCWMRATVVSLALVFGAGRAQAQRALGVDVSSYQGSGVNWGNVKGAGISFAWAKATEGTAVIDADFTINENNGKAAGVYMGAYHFAHPEFNTPGAEAGYFWNEAGGYIRADGLTLMPMLDMEVFQGVTGESTYSQWVNAWSDAVVADASGQGVVIKPFIYISACNAGFLDSSVSQWFSDIANYNGENPQTGGPWNVCGGDDVWGNGVWTVWQYTDAGYVGDGDVFGGTVSSLTSTCIATSSFNNSSINPCAATTADGRVELFAVGTDGHLYTDYQTTPCGPWSGWIAMGGSGNVWTENCIPAVGVNSDGRLEVFIVGTDGSVNHNYQLTPGSSATANWSGFSIVSSSFVSQTAKLAVGHWGNGALDLFVVGTDGVLYHNYQTSGGWSGFESLGGSWSQNVDIAVANDENGEEDVFLIGNTGNLYNAWQSSPNQNSWSGWNDLGGSWAQTARTALGHNSSGELEIFIIGSTTQLYHDYETSVNGQTSWSGWNSLGGGWESDAKPVWGVDKNADEELFLIGHTGNMYQNYLSSSGWSGWIDLNGSFTQSIRPCVGINQNGIVQPFLTQDTIGDMQNDWELAPNSTSWSGWYALGSGPTITFTTQPSSQSVNVGQNATFTAVAANALAYQWTFNSANISGATGTSYTVVNAQTSNAGTYNVIAVNGGGSVTSANATLTVNGGPPVITTQPASQTVVQGQNATFSVVATGTAPLSYQWKFNSANISGATASSYTVVNAQTSNAGTYSVVITNVAGSVTSANASLTVNVPPSITTQPASQTVNQGQNATFSVVAAGTTPLSYQWKFNGNNISGATATSYTVTNAQSSNAGNYAVVVTNVAGGVTSANASLLVNVPPSITTQPANQTVNQGQNATFSVVAAGTAPLSYQWTFNGANISGATASSYTVSNAQASNAGTYAVVVTNMAGTVTSANAILTVILPPILSAQPTSQLASVSNNVTFTVALSQGTSPTYQWRFNGGNISGATASTLTLSSILWASGGTYSVVVTNPAGSTTSSNAVLTVEQAVFTYTNGFESYNLGVLDKNQSGGPNTNASNPWWGPAPPNITVYTNQGSIAPHGGSKMIGASPNLDFCQEYLNLPYRLNDGSNYYGNLLFDWWFYDTQGTGSGASNYDDYMALAEYLPVSTTNDFNTTTFTTYNQRMSLGAANAQGYNVGFYQARVVGATGGFNTNGWFNTTTPRSVGWHHARIIIGIPTGNSGPVSMYIDNMTNATFSYSSSGVNVGFNLIEINSSFGGVNTGGYFDDFTFRAANDPWIAQQPSSLTVSAGQNATFNTVAVGTAYQWQFNSSNLAGATTSSYTVTNAQSANAGTYTCNITGANGSVTTSAATLTVH